MKKPFILIFLLAVFSCGVEVTTESSTNEREIIDLSESSDILTLNQIELDIFFFEARNISRFFGLKDGQEIEVPTTLDLNFEVGENSYGFFSNINRVIQLNGKYDLIEGTVTKFLRDQSIDIDGTTFNLIGFEETTNGDFLLFDKENLDFIQLEEGFDINESTPIYLLDNKLYYVKSIPGSISDIKYIDLDNINAPPVLHHSSEFLTSFLINSQKDFLIRLAGNLGTRYLYRETNVELESESGSEPLGFRFVGLDGKFYGQHFINNANRPVKGFHSIDVNSDFAVHNEIFSFDTNDYPNFSNMGEADIVIPNPLRNTDIIISQTPIGLYFYEFSTNPVEVIPVDIELTISSFPYADYLSNEFFIVRDTYPASSDRRLRKFDFENYTSQAEVNLGNSDNGILIHQNNGSIFGLSTQNGGNSKLFEIKMDNSIEEFEMSNRISGYFSVIQ